MISEMISPLLSSADGRLMEVCHSPTGPSSVSIPVILTSMGPLPEGEETGRITSRSVSP